MIIRLMRITAVILLIVITITMLLSDTEEWKYKWSVEKLLEVANKAPNIIPALKVLLVTRQEIEIPKTGIGAIDLFIGLINGIKDIVVDLIYIIGIIGEALIVVIYYVGEILEIT